MVLVLNVADRLVAVSKHFSSRTDRTKVFLRGFTWYLFGHTTLMLVSLRRAPGMQFICSGGLYAFESLSRVFWQNTKSFRAQIEPSVPFSLYNLVQVDEQ